MAKYRIFKWKERFWVQKSMFIWWRTIDDFFELESAISYIMRRMDYKPKKEDVVFEIEE